MCCLTSSFRTQFPTVSPWQTEANDNRALDIKQSLGLKHHCHLVQVLRTHICKRASMSFVGCILGILADDVVSFIVL